MAQKALVSILLPVRNCERTLASAIRSICAQTYREWELLVLDDGSTDSTISIVERFAEPRIRLIHACEGTGISARLNQGIDESRGDYVARMDGDDVAYPERFERQFLYMEAHRDVDLVGTSMCIFGASGVVLGKRAVPEAHAEICSHPLSGFPLMHPTYFAKRSFFDRYRYQTYPLRAEDQGLLFHSHTAARFANVPDILLGYREERIELRKILRGRYYFAKVLAHELLRTRRPIASVEVIGGQLARGVVDVFAVASGLRYRILRHRASPIGAADAERWREVWRAVSIPVACERIP